VTMPPMKRAVAVSPRPGDAVLSCGATLAGLAAGGWAVTVVTVFDAGEEDRDRRAGALLGVGEVVGLGLARGGGATSAQVAAALGPVLDGARPDRVLAPLGSDPDAASATALDALAWLAHPAPAVRWREVPHALRAPAAKPLPDERGIPIAAQLERKLGACAVFAAPLGFGDAGALRAALTAFHAAEGRRLGVDGPAEALVEPPRDPRRERARRAEAEREERAALARLRAQLGG
jgi:LmbE family N-acetylglucosaminyl deacetylase